MKLLKSQLKQRPTYEILVKDSILNPNDKIALPHRAATVLRKTQQLSRYDDVEFIDLETDNENIMREQAQQYTLRAAALNNDSGSMAKTRAESVTPVSRPPGGGETHQFSL